jgi:hypothetical protein
MSDSPRAGWAGLFAFARVRHGAFHLRRCPDFGLSRSTVRHRAAREGWERPYPGVLCLPGSQSGWWRAASARMEAVGSDVALWRRAAAYAQRMISQPPVLTEVVRAHGLHRPQLALCKVSTSRSLDESQIRMVEGLRCTTPARTMHDLATVLELPPLRAIAIEAVQAGVLDLDDLVAHVAAVPPGGARARLARVLEDLRRVPAESLFAFEVITALQDSGCPAVAEFPWSCPNGRIIHFDAAVPQAWVAVECDGQAKYTGGRSFTTDRIRWTQASGSWRTVWVDWERWRSDRAGVLADVVRAVAEADATRAPAVAAACRCRRCRRRDDA